MRRGQRSAHRSLSLAMAAAIALTLILAFAFGQSRTGLPAPERLSPPEDGR